jgi:energy-coupling factor transporter ATP-binding protein EcfA2
MITRIELTNFMSHDHTVIEPAAGLTVLIGPNNCGKSAIVAALQILANNDNSTYVMRHGAKECSVKVETDDGHTVEWRRKNSPSYVIDGQTFDRLRGAGLPDELHAALRLPKVDAGENTEFDVHFGTQKSPIFLLGGSTAHAARFFAASSDAIRLVAIQKRHKEKLAEAQREKNRLEVESKQINAALEILGPVVELEERLEVAREAYDQLLKRDDWVEEATKGEALLRAKSATVDRFSAEAAALQPLHPPPEFAPTEPLQKLIEALVSAEGRLKMAESRAAALALLPQPPNLTPVEAMEKVIRDLESEHSRQRNAAARNGVLASLEAPPELADTDAIVQLTAGIERATRLQTQTRAESQTLSQLPSPPQLAELDPLLRLTERLASAMRDLSRLNSRNHVLEALADVPQMANESELAAMLSAITNATRQVANWQRMSTAVAAVGRRASNASREGSFRENNAKADMIASASR